MVNRLTTIRTEIKDALTEAGIKAIEYVQENINPPVAIVVPNEPYISVNVGNTFQKPYTVNIQILLLGSKASNKGAAENMDSMIVNVIDALDDWDITEVTAPGEVSVKGIVYSGVVVTLENNTNIEKEAN